MSIRLNGSTSGYTEIDAPAVAGSNTLVLPGGNGSSGQYLQTNGSGTLSWSTSGLPAQALTRATAAASTSGTSIDFTSIPSTVKRITVMFSGVSTNGTSHFLVRIGDSGGIATSGYASGGIITANGITPSGVNSTAGFVIFNDNVAFSKVGNFVINNITGNTWVASYALGQTDTIYGGTVTVGGGNITLSNTLDRIRITTVNGTDAFDAGTINILYEG